MKNKIFSIVLTSFVLLMGLQSCDKDKFADLNSDPSVISQPDVRFLITKSMQEMYNEDYLNWYYTYNNYVFPYSQVLTSSTAGNLTTFNTGALTGGQNLYSTLVPAVDARLRIDKLEGEKLEGSKAMRALTYPIVIYTALSNLDYSGGMPYTEAGLAASTNPPLLTPKVETEEELLNLWLEQLNGAIADLTKTGQFSLGTNQDLIYNNDYGKWAKFSNLLKLRIAARLVNVNKAKAISIAEQVAASTYMDAITDDCLFNEGKNYRGTGNGVPSGYAAKNLVDFLKVNKDPRLRFIFRKNDFSPEVIDAIIATNGVESLPSEIKAVIDLTVDGKFAGWKAGSEEPWVRYWGAPVSTNAISNDEYFKQGTKFYAAKADGSGRKTYEWTSRYEEKNQRTTMGFTFATKPGGSTLEIKGNEVPLYVLLGSAAETNFYLAEFKLLGANLPQSANTYFQKGIRLSIERMNDLANKHRIPYYNEDPVLANPADGATKLKAGEIDALLTKPAYMLTGTDDLEKVYIQQYVHFCNTPGDLWTTVRRSGIPKIGSSYLAWEDFGIGNIPRRVMIRKPEAADLDFAIWNAYYKAAGITTGENTASVLSNERLWFDKNNPAYGAGPKK